MDFLGNTGPDRTQPDRTGPDPQGPDRTDRTCDACLKETLAGVRSPGQVRTFRETSKIVRNFQPFGWLTHVKSCANGEVSDSE